MNTQLSGNPRYQPKQLVPDFGYDNLYRTVAEVELATLDVLADIGVIPAEEIGTLTPEKREQVLNILTTEVDKVEREITRHDIRAWVRIAQEILGQKLGRWLHIPLTSYDPLSTGRSLQFIRAHKEAVLPSLQRVIQLFAGKSREYAGLVQIGRTHGQHALPVTVGFWFATILDRILRNAQEMDRYIEALEGKISGAVGAHNAQIALGFAQKCGDKSFEERVLERLGLKPAPISTQILPPEGLAYYLFSCTMMTGVLEQFGRDGHNLMRSEIAEIAESFEAGQVGSSTMAHKRNPLNFENLEGTHKKTLGEFLKVILTLTSEHQRDLTGSSVSRDFPTIVVNLQLQLNTLLRENNDGIPWLSRLTVSKEALDRNLDMSGDFILAEPMYIAMQMAGYEVDAHELVNHTLIPLAKEGEESLLQALNHEASENPQVQSAMENIPDEVLEALADPKKYIGDAKELALAVAQRAQEYIQ